MENILPFNQDEILNLDLDTLIAAEVEKEEIAEAKRAVYEEQAKAIAQAEAERQAVQEAYQRIYVDGDFTSIRAAIEMPAVETFLTTLSDQFAERVEFEREKNPKNFRIQKTLQSVRTGLVRHRSAQVMMACDLEASFLNQSVKKGERFNVYAIDKALRFVQQLDFGAIGNAINNAVFQTMWNFMNAGLEFTSETAKCAASNGIRLTEGQRGWAQHLVRHTVSPGVASTQSSSTLRAMEVLGLAKQTGMKGKAQVWQLIDGPATRHIASKMGLAV